MDLYILLISGTVVLLCAFIRHLIFWQEKKECRAANKPYVKSNYVRDFFTKSWQVGGMVDRRFYLHFFFWELHVRSMLVLFSSLLMHWIVLDLVNFYVFAVLLVFLFFVAIVLPKFVFMTRRLNDAGYSMLWIFVPIISVILCFQPSKLENNKYCPKGNWDFEKTRKEIFDTIYLLENELIDKSEASKIIKEKVQLLQVLKDERISLALEWKRKGYLLGDDYRELVYGTWD